MDDKKSGIFTGISGVHHVVSELSRRGFIALPTVRNCPGFDVIVSDLAGKSPKVLQIKTSKGKVAGWPCAAKDEYKGNNWYFVFLRWLGKEKRYDIFMEKGSRVVKRIRQNDLILENRKNKAFGKMQFFMLPKNEKSKEKLRQNWTDFGPNN
jgi:hypothetical protein